MVGVPVIINHKDLNTDNVDNERVGVVNSVWYDDKDGWYWCDGIIWDETAQNLITDKNWSVSCSYDVKTANDEGGSENNIPYDMEFLDGVFTHLALVDNPRYERANIVFNSKTEVLNGGNGSGNFGHAGRPGQVGGSSSGGTVDLTNYFSSNPTIQDVKDFLNEMVKQGKEFATSSPDWFVDIPNSSKKKDHIAKSSQFQSMNKAQKHRHNKYVMALEDLLGNAQYLKSSPNTKQLKKPNTQQYHYFKSEAKIGPKTYKIMFDTEEYKGDSTIKPQTVHLYDVREVKNNSSLSANVLRSVKNLKKECTNIINAIQGNFNPNVKEHEEMNIQNWNEQDHPRDEQGKFTEKGNHTAKSYYEKEYQEALKEIAEGRDYAQINFNTNIGKMKSALAHLKRYDSDWDKYDVYFNIQEYEDLSDDWNKEQIGRIAREKAAQDTLKKWISEGKDRKNEYYKIYEPHRYKSNNNKETEMALLDELKKLITKVENDKGDENMTIENEKVDKRKLIDEVGGILKGKVDDEIIRTIIGKMEKMSYDKSEAGTADNEKEEDKKDADNCKVKNEDKESEKDEKEVEEVKEEVKKDVENKCGKKADKSVDNSKPDYFGRLNEIYNTATSHLEEKSEYVSRADREKAAEDYFARS